MLIACCSCGQGRLSKPTAAGAPRTPAGWKHHLGRHYCGDCWARAYLQRSILLPVASPLDSTWTELREALKEAWGASTSACNWMMTELYARDVRRRGSEKMPPMPAVYLYPEARDRFPVLPAQAIASLEHACQRKYRAQRYDIIWTCAATLPTYRYPTPFPIPAQAWQANVEHGTPVVTLRLGDRRQRLRLKSGPRFRRQYEVFLAMVEGSAVRGEASLLEQGADVLFRIAVWLPRTAVDTERSGTLSVRTGEDCLLSAHSQREKQSWIYNGDHLRRWQAEHARRLRRWAQDESSVGAPAEQPRRDATLEKYHNRMDSACHEIAAQLADFAVRRRYAAVRYDDRDQRYGRGLPWARLRALLTEKLDAAGIPLQWEGTPARRQRRSALVEA